jgi:hypothetical protein
MNTSLSDSSPPKVEDAKKRREENSKRNEDFDLKK